MLRTIHFNYYPLFCFEEFETYHTMRLEMYQVNFTNNEVIFFIITLYYVSVAYNITDFHAQFTRYFTLQNA